MDLSRSEKHKDLHLKKAALIVRSKDPKRHDALSMKCNEKVATNASPIQKMLLETA